jgi:molecular chaperone GrpE
MKKKNEKNNKSISEDELIAEADQEIEEIDDKKLKELEDQLKRAVADYQNLEKRTEERRSEWILSANKDLIKRLLPGLDNLLLSDLHSNDEGVKIAIKHFMEILENEGVKKIKTEGADFDPNLMEAVSAVDGQDGKVVDEIKAGYTLNGELIRVAQVTVGNGKN